MISFGSILTGVSRIVGEVPVGTQRDMEGHRDNYVLDRTLLRKVSKRH